MKPSRPFFLLLIIGISFTLPAFAEQLEDRGVTKAWADNAWSGDLLIISVLLLAINLLNQALLNFADNAYKRGDYKTALKLFTIASRWLLCERWTQIGDIYKNGLGVTQDYVEAVKWYSKAAKNAVYGPIVQMKLGDMYRLGLGVPQSITEAAKYYRLAGLHSYELDEECAVACESGDSHRLIRQDYVEAYRWYSLAATHAPWKDKFDEAIRNRDRVGIKMTPEQLDDVYRWATEYAKVPTWIPENQAYVERVAPTTDQADTAGKLYTDYWANANEVVDNVRAMVLPCYAFGAVLTGFVVFIGSWIYCINTYGYLVGVGIGWLPSLITAVIVGALWPLIIILLGLGYWFSLKHQ